MATHEVSTYPTRFNSILSGNTRFEVVRENRDFRVGDSLKIRERDPDTREFTGRYAMKTLAYVVEGGANGVDEGNCILGLC